jgi:hypothetical protein
MPSKKSSAFCQYLYYIAFAGVFLRGEINKCAVNGYESANPNDLKSALDAVLSGQKVTVIQKPSSGCNIKWKPGNEPIYFIAHQFGV